MVQNNDMPLVFTMNLASDIEAMSKIAEKAIKTGELRMEDLKQPSVNMVRKEQLLSTRGKVFG